MRLDLGRIIGRTFSISWRYKWLWLLGIFGGGAGGGSFSSRVPTSGRNGFSYNAVRDQAQAFLNHWLWLLLVLVAVVLVIAIVAFLISCIAVPASIWAALHADGGGTPTLRSAWGQGTRLFGRYLRLGLIRLAVSLALLLVLAILVGVGIAIYASAGSASLVALVPIGVLLFLVYLAAALVISFFFAWSARTALILDVGAIDALRTSTTMSRRAIGTTLLFAIVMGLLVGVMGFGVFLAAAIVAVPGIIALIAGLVGSSTVAAVLGAVWITIVGGAVLVGGGGFLGSIVQVSWALACRDLCVQLGLNLGPDVPGSPPAPIQSQAPPPALA